MPQSNTTTRITDSTGANRVAVSTAGTLATHLTNPGLAALGIYAGLTGYGEQRVTTEPSMLFADPFDGAFDTNKWITGGTVVPTVVGGRALVEAASTASASSSLVSNTTFAPPGGTFLGLGMINRFENVAGAAGAAGYLNSHRFFGLGTIPATTWTTTYTAASTTANPLLNAYGFEIDTDGYLYAVVYDNGTRTRADAIGQATGEKRLNLGRSLFNGELHQFTLVMRADAVFWYIDGQDTPAAVLNYRTAGFPVPDQQTLPIRIHTLNSATAPSGTMWHRPGAIALADTGHNNMMVSDGTYPWRKVQVGKSGGMAVKGASVASQSTTFAVAGTGTAGPLDVSEAGNVTFVVKNQITASPWTGNPVLVFEQSDDNANWAPLPVVSSQTNNVSWTHTLSTNPGSVMYDAGLEGVNYVRARVTTGPSSFGMIVNIVPGGLAFSPAIAMAQPVRTTQVLYATGVTSAATATETLFSLTRSLGTAATTTGTSFANTTGKTFRIQSITIAQAGNATTATAAVIVFRLRYNSAGAVATTTTPVLWNQRLVTPATLNGFASITQTFSDGLDIPQVGTSQWGFSYLSTYTTNAPTLDITVVGYEY